MAEFKFDKNFNPGAFKDRFDSRDYQYEPLASAIGEEAFDWEKGFDIEEELGIKLKVENQNGSSSCVGQATHKYGEVLELVENKKLPDFSAKWVYAQIHLPNGGAYCRDACKVATGQGFALEKDLPSYTTVEMSDGKIVYNAPTEEFITKSEDITQEIRQKALPYKGLKYYSVRADIDLVAQAIKNHWGLLMAARGSNLGWREPKGIVRPPKSGENQWGHAIFGLGAKMLNGKKAIRFINSWSENWGDKGYCWFTEDYFNSGNMYSSWVIIDQKNINLIKPMRLVKTNDSSTVYMIDLKGYRRAFYDKQHFDSVAPLVSETKFITENDGKTDWSKVETITKEEMDKLPLGRPLWLVD